MARESTVEEKEKSRRVGLTFEPVEFERFLALAEFDARKPATLALEVVRAFMESRATDIDSVLRARADYEKKIDELRQRKSD